MGIRKQYVAEYIGDILLMNTKIIKDKIAAVLASVRVEEALSPRLATILNGGDIHTMDVLYGKSEAELLKLNGLGKKSLSEMREYWEEIGVCRPPYYDMLGSLHIKYVVEGAGYTEGVSSLFREVLDKTGIMAMSRRDGSQQ